MSAQFISKLLVSNLFLYVIVACGGSIFQEPTQTIPSAIPPSIKFIPIDVSNSSTNQQGWQSLEIQTAITNLYSEFRLFVFNCGGNLEISVTSFESRKESIKWWFNSDCTVITLPPGIIIRNPSNISGGIPLNMTDIEVNIPYADLPMNVFPRGIITSNSVTKLALETDFVDVESIKFPVYDETLLNVHEVGENFDLAKAKILASTFAELQDDTISVQISLQNTNSLGNSQVDVISILGVGSDGILRGAEKLGGQCRPPLVGSQRTVFDLEAIGPNQTISCNVKFSEIPTNVNNFYIWFILSEYTDIAELTIVDSGMFRFNASPP